MGVGCGGGGEKRTMGKDIAELCSDLKRTVMLRIKNVLVSEVMEGL